MATKTCAACGKVKPPFAFYEDTNWCEDCVELELLDQSLEDTDRVLPEIFSA